MSQNHTLSLPRTSRADYCLKSHPDLAVPKRRFASKALRGYFPRPRSSDRFRLYKIEALVTSNLNRLQTTQQPSGLVKQKKPVLSTHDANCIYAGRGLSLLLQQ
ncbi:hypothetical protein A9F13_01g06831 [Clavispora lusitaniae]|uniref:Uncharacterized protein n=1 Tax=Clavispora lusitaniae TaxID=36911 RepID=A0AA91T4G1_CLALS|nr:hypothetical protein A9F13_01g06831 [Clavispora lusitaniae]